MSDDVRKELQGRWVKAQADYDLKHQRTMMVAEKVYANPRAAVAEMMKFSKKYDDPALIAKLEKEPEKFGAMKGHFRSGEAFYTPQGMRDKAIAKEQAQQLPGLVKSTMEANTEVVTLERALEARGLSEGLSKGKGGIDF